jgi:poly(A) polymerase
VTRITEDWLGQAPTQRVCKALTDGGARALFVGGCVRNALIGVPVSDIDIATDAPPARVMALAEAAGINAVPTGFDHGTVTLVADGHSHEVTTFRRDVSTDGRRAVVAFSDRIEDDAARRDFTMNALYAEPDGTVLDPLDQGLDDLAARRVRFIGDASQRIREDYLRALRYFRFHAWFGHAEAGPDPEALAAIAAALDGLDRVSAERVGHEMLKLLAAPDPAQAVGSMAAIGVLARLLPGATTAGLAPLIQLEGTAHLPPDPVRRLAALGSHDAPERLRLSRHQAHRLARLQRGMAEYVDPAEAGYRLGASEGREAWILRLATLAAPWSDKAGAAIENGARQSCPVSARDLMPEHQGPALGARLAELEDRWIASGFALSRDDLLGWDRTG